MQNTVKAASLLKKSQPNVNASTLDLFVIINKQYNFLHTIQFALPPRAETTTPLQAPAPANLDIGKVSVVGHGLVELSMNEIYSFSPQAEIELVNHLCQTLTEYIPHLWDLGQAAIVNQNVAKLFAIRCSCIHAYYSVYHRKREKAAHKLMEDDDDSHVPSRVEQVTV